MLATAAEVAPDLDAADCPPSDSVSDAALGWHLLGWRPSFRASSPVGVSGMPGIIERRTPRFLPAADRHVPRHSPWDRVKSPTAAAAVSLNSRETVGLGQGDCAPA
jgi:hypothetical protein